MSWLSSLLGGGVDHSAAVKSALAAGGIILDVRTPEEFAGGHVKGALNIPVQVLPARMGDVGPKDKTIIVYCRSGGRSAAATQLLKQAGYANIIDVGPMSAFPAV